MKRFLALLLTIALMLSLFPAVTAASAEEDYAPLRELFGELREFQDGKATRNSTAVSESTIQSLIEKIESSENYLEGSLERNDRALTWRTTDGIPCWYSLYEEENRGESEGTPIVPPESGYEHISYAKKGQPNGKDVYLVAPFYGYDSQFTDHYKTVASSIADVTGGSYTLYSGTNATIDNVAKAISNGAIVLVDSHGTYGNSKSYLRLKTNAGITSADDTNNNYFYEYTSHGDTWMVTGDVIVNHMTKNAPNSFVWFGICSGMRYNTMHKPVMAKGVESTFGYSRTISFHFDRNWLSAFVKSINAGNTVATAAAAMKKSVGYWDRCDESAYDTKTEAINAGKAFPIFVSPEDAYPSDRQNYQTVNSTWKLAACTHPNLKAVAAKAATCTAEGNIAYYTCSTCKGYFANSSASSETTSDKVMIKALGHSYSGNVCSRCGDVTGSLLWHFWPGSTEAKYTWVGEGTSTGETPPTLTTTGRGTLKSISGGGDHYFHMLQGSYMIGHAVKKTDIIEVRYRTTKVPSTMLNKSTTFEFWYSTPASENSSLGFKKDRIFKASTTMKENTWQTVTFQPTLDFTLQRVLFDFLQEDNNFSDTTLELDYMYIGPAVNAPSAQKSDELWFDFTNKEIDQYRYAGDVYGDFSFDSGKWYVGNLSAQSMDNTKGEFVGTMNADVTSCYIRTGVDGTANEAQLVYKPGKQDYFQTRFKITDAEATAENLNIDFYFYSKTDNAWHSARATANKSILGDYYVASIPMSAVADYQNASSISSVQMNLSNFKSASGKTAKIYVDYIYVGATTPNPVEHDYDVSVTAPTCTEGGYTTYTCKLCGYSYKTDTTDPTNHANTRTETTQATCDQSGEVKVICNDCGKVISTTTVPGANHAQTTTMRIEPTCTTDGEIKEVCELCGQVISSEPIPATGHNYVSTITPPTCTEGGYTTKVCACGDTVVTDQTPATNHSYTSKVTTAPTCENKGIRTYTCTCGDSYTEDIPAIGHDYASALTQATCTTDGYTSYTCNHCGHTYKDHIVPAFGHAYSYDNNENGTHTVTCAYNCGYKTVTDCVYTEGMCICGAMEVIICKHINTTVKTTLEPTCTTTGTRITVCDDCGETVLTETIAANGHTLTTVKAIAATCTTDGVSSHWLCEICGKHFADAAGKYVVPEQYFIVKATGHETVHLTETPATCTESGISNCYQCKNCKQYYFDEACQFPAPEDYIIIAPLGHNLAYSNNGSNHTVTCSRCKMNETQPHVFVNKICVCGAEKMPEYDANLKFTMNISIGAEIVVNYSFPASAVSNYSDFYLKVTKNVAGGEPITTVYGLSGDREAVSIINHPVTGEALLYQTAYRGINAKEMGDNFSTTLYAVDEEGSIYYSKTVDSSIKDYMLGKIDEPNAKAEYKTMAVDMLKYGAAAQVHMNYDTNNLVTSSLTSEQLGYATQGTPEAIDRATETTVGANITKNIVLGSKVQLKLNCIYKNATDPSAVKCVIIGEDGLVIAELPTTNMAGVMFVAAYENVGARQMRDVFTATFFENGMPISKTITWSVESYVAQTRAMDNVSQSELNLVNAMLAYGDSVGAYMTANGQ